MKNKAFVFFLLFFYKSFAQSDSLPYTLFSNKLVLYADLGYSSAPFSISYPYGDGINRLKYKNNYRNIIGFGLSYKWFALRIGIPLPGYARSTATYGQTTPINLGFDFSFKKVFCDVDIRSYEGYAIKDANSWNDTLTIDKPNDLRPKTKSQSFSMNAWYFHNKDFKMSALRGKTGHYKKDVHTWYLKNTFNIFGVTNDQSPIIPLKLIDSSNTKTSSNYYSALDFGVVPGYAYVKRKNQWQISGLAGLGAVIQTKLYDANGNNRSIIGLAPRYDIRLIGGYSVPSYFVFLVTDFDNKSIRFNDLVYRQYFYSIKIVAGKRFIQKDKSKKSSKS